jgi:rhomboid protease GluP
MSLSELARFHTRRQADDLRFILEGGGVPAVIEPVPGAGNGSGPAWAVLVPEEHLERARAILREETPDRPKPLALPIKSPPFYWTLGLVVVNLLVWIAMEGNGGSERRGVLLRFGASHAPRLRAGEWWRTISATFIHIGLRHLLANMFSLVILGPAVMAIWGVGRTYFLYLVAGVAGNWFSFAISPTRSVKAGASGCVLGLLGNLAGARIRGVSGDSRFKTWHIVAMLVAFYGFVVGVGAHVDHLAHLGGLLGGGLLALALPPPGRLPARRDRLLAAMFGGVAALAAAAAGLLAYLSG